MVEQRMINCRVDAHASSIINNSNNSNNNGNTQYLLRLCDTLEDRL